MFISFGLPKKKDIRHTLTHSLTHTHTPSNPRGVQTTAHASQMELKR